MYIVGIDPSLAATGIVFWRDDQVLAHYTEKKETGIDGAIRLGRRIGEAVGHYMDIAEPKNWPFLVAIEEPILRNAHSHKVQAYLVGAILASLPRALPWENIYLIHPSTAKKALTGSGRADKAAMIAASGFDPDEKNADAIADALGIALAAKEKHEQEVHNGRQKQD